LNNFNGLITFIPPNLLLYSSYYSKACNEFALPISTS